MEGAGAARLLSLICFALAGEIDWTSPPTLNRASKAARTMKKECLGIFNEIFISISFALQFI
jgi:hypothetical protein